MGDDAMSGNYFEIDLDNYPKLKYLFQTDKQEFAALVKPILIMLNDTSEYFERSKREFNMPLGELVLLLIESFFDYEGILKHHPNDAEREALAILEHENNPLSIFTNESAVYDSKGNKLTAREFTSSTDFKNWFQGMLYASRYLDHAEYVRYLQIGKYDLMEASKYKHVKQLLAIQPALKFQEKNTMPIGLRIEGTGFFDCGEWNEGENCHSCKQSNLTETENHVYCLDCKAGFKK